MGGHLTLGIDIGTTNVKAAILDTNTGKVVASGSQEHPLFHPFPGWAEQDASNYWGAVVSSIRQCLEQGRFADDIAAVALSGLVGVTLPVSDQGKPLRQAMIWMDSRSEEECEDIRRSVGEATINKNNGNRIAPWFIDPKALWIKKHEPHIFNATHKFLSPSGYCTYRMCGNFTMNTGDAGLAYAYEYREERWNESVARAIGIPLEKLPRLYQSHEVVGEVTRQAAEETGLRPGTIVAAGGTDISSAALGVGVTKAGEAYYSMGTGSNLGIMIPTEQNVEEYRILKWPHVLPGLTMFDGPMAFTGASLKWFRDQFGDAEFRLAERMGHNVFDLFTEQARRVPACSDGLLYLPYLGNTLSPNWNSNACGNFFGVRPTTTRAHFIRALIEGVAFDLYSNVRVANAAGVKVDGLILNGGPTKSRFWNQITASVVNLPLKTPDIGEAAPIGDAILAGVAAGIYKSPTDPLESIVRIKETIDPDPKLHERYRDFFEVWSSVYQNLRGDMDRHRALLNKYHSA
ncbi:xylulokinase [Mesorhizobium shonense]|uniref:Xylulokinase n=1 Tax=Mesorhizobium shonense TaxID=1209948 RepID=A0ABV2HMA9_9HYPH